MGVRVVVGQLVQALAAPQVATAVTCPAAGALLALQQERHQGAADDARRLSLALRQGQAKLAIQPLQALAQLHEPGLQRQLGRQLRQGIDDQAAGDMPAMMPTHAIGHRPHPLPGGF